MGITIFRPGRRVVIPSPGVQVWSPGVASAAASTWWNDNGAISGCIAAYQAKGVANLATSYTNLANPGTYTAAPGVAPTHSTADGWSATGTQYLLTGINATATMTVICRYSDQPASGTLSLFGSSATNAAFYVRSWFAGDVIRGAYGNGAITSTASGGSASGVLAYAAGNIYKNGSFLTTYPGTFSGTGIEIIIFGRNNGGTPGELITAKIQALAIYNVTLTAGQVATITTAMAAL